MKRLSTKVYFLLLSMLATASFAAYILQDLLNDRVMDESRLGRFDSIWRANLAFGTMIVLLVTLGIWIVIGTAWLFISVNFATKESEDNLDVI